jgi:hypothetical protein
MKNAKTEKALSSLEWAIAQSMTSPKQDDEFTTEEFAESTKTSAAASRSRLNRMVKSGMLVRRKILIESNYTNLFRKAD